MNMTSIGKSTWIMAGFCALLFVFSGCSTSAKKAAPNSIESFLYDLDFKSATEIQLRIKDCEMSCAPADADLARTLADVLNLEQQTRNQIADKSATKKTGKKSGRKSKQQNSSARSDLKEQLQVVQVYSSKIAPLCERFREGFKDKAAALNWSAGLCLAFIDTPAKERFFAELISYRGKPEQDLSLTYRMARYALESGKPYVETESLVNECLKLDPSSVDCQKLMTLVKDKFWNLTCDGNDIDKTFLFLPVSDRQTKNLSKTIITDDRVVFGDPSYQFSNKQISKLSFVKVGKGLAVDLNFYTGKVDLSKQLKKAGTKWGVMIQNQLSFMGNKSALDNGSIRVSISSNQAKLESEFKKICTKN